MKMSYPFLNEAVTVPKASIDELIKKMTLLEKTKYKDAEMFDSFIKEAFDVNDRDSITYMKDQMRILGNDKFRSHFVKMLIFSERDFSDIYMGMDQQIKSEISETKGSKAYAFGLSCISHMHEMNKLAIAISYQAQSEMKSTTNISFATGIQAVFGTTSIATVQKMVDDLVGQSKNPLKDEENSVTAGEYCEELDETVSYLGELSALFKEYNDATDAELLSEGIKDAAAEGVKNVGKGARVVGNAARSAAEKIKEFRLANKVREKKLGQWFDNVVDKKIASIKEDRKNQKYAQIAKESSNLSREISRALKTLPLSLIHPGIGAALFIASLYYDHRMDKKYKSQIMGDLKLTEKILDERISMAERAGDDEKKLELIVEKDKVSRALQKLQKG